YSCASLFWDSSTSDASHRRVGGLLHNRGGAVSSRPRGRSRHGHGIVKVNRGGGWLDGGGQWLPHILIHFDDRRKGIVHVREGFVEGIALGEQLRQDRARDGIATFRLGG